MRDFTAEEIKGLGGSDFGNVRNYCCNGCGANFKNAQGLSSHKIQ